LFEALVNGEEGHCDESDKQLDNIKRFAAKCCDAPKSTNWPLRKGPSRSMLQQASDRHRDTEQSGRNQHDDRAARQVRGGRDEETAQAAHRAEQCRQQQHAATATGHLSRCRPRIPETGSSGR